MANEIAAPTTDIVIDEVPETVWAALTDAASWLGEGSTISAVRGGELDVNDVVSGTRRRGVVTQSKHARVLRFDWWPVGDVDQATSVTVELEEVDAGTHVIITETLPRAVVASASACANWRGPMLSCAASAIRV